MSILEKIEEILNGGVTPSDTNIAIECAKIMSQLYSLELSLDSGRNQK